MGKIKGFMLNRKQYDRIRRMDHCQMTLWAESVYKSGYTDGHESASGLTAPEIREALLCVKGIGEKKVDVITAALEEAMEQKIKTSGKILLMARIKTDIMVWSKAFLSKCKLQKWNFVTKPPHRGCDAYNLTQNVTFVK